MNEEREALEIENLQKKEERQALLQQKKEEAPIKKTRLTRESPEKIMEKIEKAEAKKKELSDSCYLEENYSSPEKMKKIESEISRLDATLEKLYADLDLAM